MLAVFCSIGLFFCFFVPSGVFLFVAGAFVASGELHYSFFAASALLILACVAGNIAGYFFGWKTGTILYKREDSRFFKRKHLLAAEAFYKKYGWLTLTVGLFLPIIRTFAPVVAGIVKHNIGRFILLTFIGSALWVLSFVSAGYFIASMPLLKPWLNYIVIGFILLVTFPLAFKTVRELKKVSREKH